MNDQPEKGTWILYKCPTGEDANKKPIGQIEEMDDCDGDILFDYMTENDFVEDWDEYETDGGRESVAVMHKTGTQPDYCWEFSPEIEPDEPDEPDEPEEEVEPYQRPIEVYCSTCKEWTDESRHKFVDISEGMIGEDRLTFECVKCKQESTSSRVAR